MRYYEIICEIICDTMWHYVCICIIQQELWLPSVPFSHHLRVEVISARCIPFKAHSLQARDGKGWQGARDGKGFKIFCIWASDFCDIRLEQLQSQLPIVAGGTSRKGCGTVETVHFELASLPRTLKISVQMWYLCGAYCWCFWYRCFFSYFATVATVATVATYRASWMEQLWSYHIWALLHGSASFNFVSLSLLCCAIQRKVEKANGVLLNVQAHPIQNFNRHLGSKWQSSADVHCLFVYLFSLGSFFCKTLSSTSHFLGAMHCMALWHEWKLHCCICTVRLCAPILRVQLHVQPVFPSAWQAWSKCLLAIEEWSNGSPDSPATKPRPEDKKQLKFMRKLKGAKVVEFEPCREIWLEMRRYEVRSMWNVLKQKCHTWRFWRPNGFLRNENDLLYVYKMWDGQNKMRLRNSMPWDVQKELSQKGPRIRSRRPSSAQVWGIMEGQLLYWVPTGHRSSETHEVFNTSRLEKVKDENMMLPMATVITRVGERVRSMGEHISISLLATFQFIQFNPIHVSMCLWFCVSIWPSLREFVTKHSRSSAGSGPSGLIWSRCHTHWVYRARQSWEHSNIPTWRQNMLERAMLSRIRRPEASLDAWPFRLQTLRVSSQTIQF